MSKASANAHLIKISPRRLPIVINALQIVVRLIGENRDKIGITIDGKRYLMPRANAHNNTPRSIEVEGFHVVEIGLRLLGLVPATVWLALCGLAKHHIEWFTGKRDKSLGVSGVVFHPTYFVGSLCEAHEIKRGVIVGFELGGIRDSNFLSIKVNLVTHNAGRLAHNPTIAFEAFGSCHDGGEDVVAHDNLRSYRHFLNAFKISVT
jgi:hypothetical protein